MFGYGWITANRSESPFPGVRSSICEPKSSLPQVTPLIGARPLPLQTNFIANLRVRSDWTVNAEIQARNRQHQAPRVRVHWHVKRWVLLRPERASCVTVDSGLAALSLFFAVRLTTDPLVSFGVSRMHVGPQPNSSSITNTWLFFSMRTGFDIEHVVAVNSTKH